MPKVILVTSEQVTLGMENGTLREVLISDLNFSPRVGDCVEIFETGDRLIVSKVEKAETTGVLGNGIPVNTGNSGMGYRRPVNKYIYCLLAIFLGDFGIHKFYAGRIGSGVVCILFCWTLIPGIIGFFWYFWAV